MDVLWMRRSNKKLKDRLVRHRGTRAWSFYVPKDITDAVVDEICPRYFIEHGVDEMLPYAYSLSSLAFPHNIVVLESRGKVKMKIDVGGLQLGSRFGYRLVRINYAHLDGKSDELSSFIRDTYWVGYKLTGGVS